MPVTYEPIATTTLGASAASFTLSSIPATYTDLRLLINAFSLSSRAIVTLRFNSDTGSNYSGTLLRGNGTAASSATDTSATKIDLIYDTVAGTTIPALFEVDVFSYAGSTNKTILCKTAGDRNGAGQVAALVGLWRDTAVINSVTVIGTNVDLGVGTTATLYGIKNA